MMPLPEPASPALLYCRCAYAQVVPQEVKDGVLDGLCASGQSFDSVADLCEMAARRDPRLRAIAEGGAVKIAACQPRAVKWLFHSAGAPLTPESSEIVNMCEADAAAVLGNLLQKNDAPAAGRP